MRTTIRFRADLLKRAKLRAAEEGRTLTSLIEEGLALVLAGSRTRPRARVDLPMSRATGGLMPGVDLNRSAELEELMDRP